MVSRDVLVKILEAAPDITQLEICKLLDINTSVMCYVFKKYGLQNTYMNRTASLLLVSICRICSNVENVLLNYTYICCKYATEKHHIPSNIKSYLMYLIRASRKRVCVKRKSLVAKDKDLSCIDHINI